MKNYKRISIVIPVFNEGDNISQLVNEIQLTMEKITSNYEIFIINDGSFDNTQIIIEQLKEKYPKTIKIIELLAQSGKAAALHAGFCAAKGDIILTLDGDLQDDPREIPRFIKKINEGYDLVSGWKHKRKDSFIKNSTSKVFNYFTNRISVVKLHDFNCGFKAYRKDTIKHLNLYGELHRYIPVLIAAKGYRVTEILVHHRKRKHGESKYGTVRFINGALDLLTIIYLTKFRSRSLHFFGYIGITFFILGLSLAIYLTLVKFVGHQSIGERPLLLFSVMLMIIGVQIGVTGLVGEQIAASFHKYDQDYIIKKSN